MSLESRSSSHSAVRVSKQHRKRGVVCVLEDCYCSQNWLCYPCAQACEGYKSTQQIGARPQPPQRSSQSEVLTNGGPHNAARTSCPASRGAQRDIYSSRACKHVQVKPRVACVLTAASQRTQPLHRPACTEIRKQSSWVVVEGEEMGVGV